MKNEKLNDKKLSELKVKHVDKYYYHQNNAEAHKKRINEINDEQVNRILNRIRLSEKERREDEK